MCMPVIFSEVSLTYAFKIVFTLVFHIFLWVILNKNHALKVMQNSDFFMLKNAKFKELPGASPPGPPPGLCPGPAGGLTAPPDPQL